MTEGDPYVYPGTFVLRNRLGIKNYKRLDRVERSMVSQRISEGVPDGKFDLAHLQAIHRHLFQDIYDWAGELRTLEINKGGSPVPVSPIYPDRHGGRSSPARAIQIFAPAVAA